MRAKDHGMAALFFACLLAAIFFAGTAAAQSSQPLYSVDYLIWTGAVSDQWDTTTANWKLHASGSPTTYINNPGDIVVFDDSASVSTISINGAGNVDPTSVTFNNNVLSYSVQGPYAIEGPTGLTMTGIGMVTISNINTYTGPTSIDAGTLILSLAGALGNTAITVSGGATFAPQPGSGSNSAGSTSSGTAGAALALQPGSVFNMTDGAVGRFNLNQQSAFSGPALTIDGATLNFDLGSAGADRLNSVKPASVSGSNTVNINLLGSVLSLGQTYNIITAPSGLNSGSFQFSNSTGSEMVAAGGNMYTITLSNSANAESLTVSPAEALGGGTAQVGGVQVTFPNLTASGTFGSAFSEPTTPQQVQQAIGALAAGEINFVLAGQTPQFWDLDFGGQFGGSATVIVHFDPSLLGSTPLADLEVEHFSDGLWVIPPNQVVNAANDTITFTTDSFSPFGLAVVPEPGTVSLLVVGAVFLASGAFVRRRRCRAAAV